MKIRTEDRFASTYDLCRFRRQQGSLRRLCVSTKERDVNMRDAALASFLILIPCSLRAQDKKSDWKALYGLRSGEKIELIETGMKKHVGTFSTVTEEAIQLREGSNDIGIHKENVARDPAREESSAPQRCDPRSRRRRSRCGNRRGGIEMFQFDWFVQLMCYSTRRRGRCRRGDWVGGGRRRRCRHT
jgi:hypothetical protein